MTGFPPPSSAQSRLPSLSRSHRAVSAPAFPAGLASFTAAISHIISLKALLFMDISVAVGFKGLPLGPLVAILLAARIILFLTAWSASPLGWSRQSRQPDPGHPATDNVQLPDGCE